MADETDTPEVEEWRDIPGWEGRYQASSLGRIKALAKWCNSKNGSLALKRTRILSTVPLRSTGYVSAVLHGPDGRQLKSMAHILVCLTFHGPKPTPNHQVAHNDGVRHNNRADNLRWATPKENASDRKPHGTERMGEAIWKTSLTAADVLAIRADYQGGYGDLTRIAKKYGVTNASILSIVKRRTWKHI